MSELYTITEQYHEKKGTYIYVLRLVNKVDKDEFDNLRNIAKEYNGYYSTFRGVNGFVFQTEENAEIFGYVLDAMFSNAPITSDELEEDDKISDDNPPETVIGKGMPLHQTLRNVILTEGQDIVKELRLVNILDDFHAYESIPASKYILRAIIADGYSAKILSLGQWNTNAQQLVEKFTQTTGFIKESVTGIFQSIAFGLGWIKDCNLEQISDLDSQSSYRDTSINPKSVPLKKPKKLTWNDNMDEDDVDKYFKAMTEYDSSTEARYKVAIENLSYYENVSNSVTLSCELRRRFRKDETVFLEYAVYDAKGRVAGTGTVSYVTNNSENPLPVMHNLELEPSNISRIRLYWKKF